MTVKDIIQATLDCDNGLVNFNNGNNRSFCFNSKWYPLRTVINRASTLANLPDNLTTDEALKELVYIFSYVKIRDVIYENNDLPLLTNSEKFDEINILSDMIQKLSLNIGNEIY